MVAVLHHRHTIACHHIQSLSEVLCRTTPMNIKRIQSLCWPTLISVYFWTFLNSNPSQPFPTSPKDPNISPIFRNLANRFQKHIRYFLHAQIYIHINITIHTKRQQSIYSWWLQPWQKCLWGSSSLSSVKLWFFKHISNCQDSASKASPLWDWEGWNRPNLRNSYFNHPFEFPLALRHIAIEHGHLQSIYLSINGDSL